MNATPESTGTLKSALAHAAKLLDTQPALAAEQATEILNAAPNHPPAVLILAVAQGRLGDLDSSLRQLESLVQTQRSWAVAHFEYSRALAAAGRGDDAIAALRTTLKLRPDHPEAWRHLADHLMAIDDTKAADEAYARHIRCSSRDPQLQRAAAAMIDNDIPTAERVLKEHLKQTPTDVPAIRMLAEVAVRCGRNDDARNLLERCLELAPGFTAARYNYATVLHRSNNSEAALAEVERLLESDARNPSYRNLCAVILSRVGEYARSSEFYAELLAEYPEHAKIWLSYGHVLKTEGRQEECIDAYRKSLARDPAFGEAYWSLANLKTFQFSAAELSTMATQVTDEDLDDEHKLHMHFALGKAAEDAGEYARAFEHYSLGNALYSAGLDYDADLNTARVDRFKTRFTQTFFAERQGSGCDSTSPIFIVGMPRSGSTLLEQILSSHSQVEGTTELPEMITLAKNLREQADTRDIGIYTEVLAAMDPAQLRELGEEYLERTRIHRKTDRHFFIDKMPNNFLHTGMIELILPNAKIIDARRHPMGCCFSNFKQYYARGQSFSYSLDDMGRFYRDYVDLMSHYDEALPGRVHRVHYENMVEHTEAEVRRLLDYCELPFEPGCLRFYENERPVRTASSEQVRQPIYSGGMEQWRHFEQWLDPLKLALGEALSSYPPTAQH